MSRDLTCKETMLPALDDGESLSDVRRLVSSNIFGRINSESLNQASSSGSAMSAGQPSFAAQINLLSGGGAGGRGGAGVPPGINHTTTVRDVVSSRMKHGKATGEALLFSVNQAVNSTPYWIKSSGPSNPNVISENANANFIQSIMHETNRSLSSVQSQGGYPVTTKYVVNSLPSTSILHQYPSTSQQSIKSSGRAPTIGIASVHNNRGLAQAVGPSQQMVVNASYLGSNGSTIVYGQIPTRIDSPNKSKPRSTTPLSGSSLLAQVQANRGSPTPRI
uniref:Uncharacterized protein n=1 Tax=Ditylenchus dipsaci TaxID=166011 RepID=A0A915D8L3_9BILA